MMTVKPKKHLGQHFLTDPNIAIRICEAVPVSVKQLLEIGPGKGVLTKQLFEKYKDNFKCIEIDDEAYNYLNDNYSSYSKNIINGDFLKLDLTLIFKENFSVIGNFPYNISSQILFKVLDYKDKIDSLVGMFQKEVALRLTSAPGTKDYGILSVLLQTWFDCEYLFTVNEGAFYPAPKVKSGVIRLTRNNRTDIGVCELLFKKIVKTAFGKRRKMLRNSLKDFNLPSDCQFLNMRPEQLSWQQFVELTKILG